MTMNKQRSWLVDQLAKSEFFHQKLHEWELLEVAGQIDQIKGEQLSWDKPGLGDDSALARSVVDPTSGG